LYPFIANKRVLITGGAGFIGSNLCEDLLKHDNEVESQNANVKSQMSKVGNLTLNTWF
jgi:nucleoside-diphosphate-sugar epimerase